MLHKSQNTIITVSINDDRLDYTGLANCPSIAMETCRDDIVDYILADLTRNHVYSNLVQTDSDSDGATYKYTVDKDSEEYEFVDLSPISYLGDEITPLQDIIDRTVVRYS